MVDCNSGIGQTFPVAGMGLLNVDTLCQAGKMGQYRQHHGDRSLYDRKKEYMLPSGDPEDTAVFALPMPSARKVGSHVWSESWKTTSLDF
jgi:hypothetical protein